MKITVIGAGYVGLITAVVFSECEDVTVIDIDEKKIASLQNGEVPFYEPGLTAKMLGPIKFSSSYSDIPLDTDLIFLAVGTPPSNIDSSADLTYLKDATIKINERFANATPIPPLVIKSTVPPGTAMTIAGMIKTDIISNPEFLREGHALDDALYPDRVVIGTSLPLDSHRLLPIKKLYQEENVVWVSNKTAELSKYASNAFLALKVSYINQIADLCERIGGNVDDVAKIMGMDQRINPHFLKVGPGYGGSCFPKDVTALIRTARNARSPLTIVESLATMNEERKIQMAQRIIEQAWAHGGGAGLRILFYGATFKEGTDDMRGAASLTIIPLVKREFRNISIYEPNSHFAKDCPEFNGCKFISKEQMNKQTWDFIVMMNSPIENGFEQSGCFKTNDDLEIVDLRNCLDVKKLPTPVWYYALGK